MRVSDAQRYWTLRLLAWCFICLGAHGQALAQTTPDAAFATLVEGARKAALEIEGRCAHADRLARLYCAGEIRIGVREDYPLFGINERGVRSGYDVDVGRSIAGRLGLRPVFFRVNAASRKAALASGQIDLLVATLSHDAARDSSIRFIRPHYYRSETQVVGSRAVTLQGLQDLAGKTLCVVQGNVSNAELVSRSARLMLFEDTELLARRLMDGSCPLVAQDESFFAYYFRDPAFTSRFETKLGLSVLPWGMAVEPDGSWELALTLDHLSQIMHRDGEFLRIARTYGLAETFLTSQQAVWNRADCNMASARDEPSCVFPPADMSVARTRFAPDVARLEAWLMDVMGSNISFPMLVTVPAWELFVGGLVNSMILIVGAMSLTFFFSAIFGAMFGSRRPLLRLLARCVTVAFQSSPVVLTLVIVAAVAQALTPYSHAMALVVAMLALGMMNGANAGQAVGEAIGLLRARRCGDMKGLALLRQGMTRSAGQIISFLVNAAKGAPAASFIGAPELLSSMNDVTAFSAGGKGVTYVFLLMFYIAVISAIVALGNAVKQRLAREAM